MSEASIPRITKAEILLGLRQLGIRPGDGLMVHSSLSSFGYVEGGAATVIEALQEVLTEAGTLMMPSFNHGAPFGEGRPGYYDPRETPTTNGAIPDFFWRLPGVERSLNPTHAFAAWGRKARRYTEFHHRTLTMGPDSPLGLLWREGGSALFFGVWPRANTFHHVVEMTLGAPCLGRRTEAYPVRLPGGRMVMGRTWGYREKPCPLVASGRYARDMAVRGMLREVRIGNCRAVLFRLQDCYEVAGRILREGTENLPPCHKCPIRPRQSPWTVPSDWDDERQCLRPDSEAWTY